MQLDIYGAMRDLATVRPLFHSEADFRFALAWRSRERLPGCDVRLEFKPLAEPLYLDIWLPTLDVAIELKFKTQQLLALSGAELYALHNHGAQNHSRYDFLADVQRLEKVVKEHGSAKRGLAVFLTNERSYWEVPTRSNTPDDEAFRLHEGRELSGVLRWSDEGNLTTKGSRTPPIVLSGRYHAVWHDYCDATAHAAAAAAMLRALGTEVSTRNARHSRFRYLAMPVGS